MKTLNNLKQYFPILILSLVLVASTLDSGAQNRHSEGRKGNEHNRDKKEYRQSDRSGERSANNEWRNRSEGNRDHRNYESRDRREEYRPQYSRNKSYAQRNYFDHPRYGRVYNRFEHNPIVFNHEHGDYYYYGDHFYTYRRGIGYCVVDSPRHIFFRELPFECRREYVNGDLFFRNGDLFFQLSSRGYEVVPSPFEIRISARF